MLPVISPNFKIQQLDVNRVFFVESFQTQKLFKFVKERILNPVLQRFHISNPEA